MNKDERQILKGLRAILTSLDSATDIRRREIVASRKIDELNLDSICAIEVCTAVHSRWGVQLNIFDFSIDATVGDVVSRIHELRQADSFTPA